MQREGRESERTGRGRKTTTGPPSRNRREREREKVDCFPPSSEQQELPEAESPSFPPSLSLRRSPVNVQCAGGATKTAAGTTKPGNATPGGGPPTDRPNHRGKRVSVIRALAHRRRQAPALAEKEGERMWLEVETVRKEGRRRKVRTEGEREKGGETAPSERGWSPPLRRVWQCSAVARPAGRRARWRGG